MQRKLGLIIVPQQTKRNQYCVHLSKSRLSFQKMDSANHTQLKHTVNSVFSFFFLFFFSHAESIYRLSPRKIASRYRKPIVWGAQQERPWQVLWKLHFKSLFEELVSFVVHEWTRGFRLQESVDFTCENILATRQRFRREVTMKLRWRKRTKCIKVDEPSSN